MQKIFFVVQLSFWLLSFMAPKMLLACGELKNAPEYVLVAVGLSGILKAKQTLGVTFNFDKQDHTVILEYFNIKE